MKIFLISILLIFIPLVYAEIGDWKSLTSADDVRQFVIADSLIWGATNGGLLKYNIDENSFFIYTNTDGLVSNDLVAVETDKKGRVWIVANNGQLTIFDPKENSWSTKNDYQGYTVSGLLSYGDSVFIALNIGVSLYDSKRMEVKETWHIGKANDITIIGDEIWVATTEGIKKANLDFPNLMAPSAWKTFSESDGLLGSDMSFVLPYESLIFVGSEKGVSVYDGENWNAAGLVNQSIVDATIYRDTLMVVTHGSVHYQSPNQNWRQYGAYIGKIRGIDSYLDTNLWISRENDGFVRHDGSTQTWEEIKPNGPVSNKYKALTIDKNGVLWAAHSRLNGGVSRYDGSQWTTFSQMNNQLNSIDYRDIAVDSLNRVWAASWGGGIAVFDQSQNNIKISFINSENGKLAGIVDNPNYVVTVGVHCDRQGNMWILNRQANNLRVLAVVDSMDNWQYFSTLDGIASTLLESFEIDLYGRKWIGTEDRGITVLDDNGTVFDTSDDDLNQGLTTVDGLESMHIRALASDVFGTNWIGTPEGLNYWSDGNVGIRYSVINDDINCIKVDARNNKWIGTSGGISVLNADGFSWQHYSTSNSPLISDNVTCFAFNENNGDVFIGTTEGLSRLETPYSRAKKTLAFVNGYPNPFILDKPGAKYIINNLAENSSVRFFTPDGALIKRIPQSRILGSQVTWDGKNEKGDLVASGIYIYLVRADGDTRVGKVAVINP